MTNQLGSRATEGSPQPARDTRPRRRRFTFVELLVVIAIIVGLAAILLPPLPSLQVSRLRRLPKDQQEAIADLNRRGVYIWLGDDEGEIVAEARGPPMNGNDLRALGRLPLLLDAQFSGVDIADDDLKSLSKQTKRRLSLANTSITDEGLRHLGNCRQLRYVDLSGTRITGTGLKHLLPLRALVGLSVRNCPINDEGRIVLARLRESGILILHDTCSPDAGRRNNGAPTQ
jgi:type II secretory pathway pseudopilin PulG